MRRPVLSGTRRLLRIGIGFDPTYPWHRRTLMGIGRFAREVGGWELVPLQYATKRLEIRRQLSRLDGLISDVIPTDPDALAPPAVCIGRDLPPHPDQVRVLTDTKAVGALAAEHLLEQGFRTLVAFHAPPPQAENAVLRVDAFVQRARKAGATVFTFGEGGGVMEKKHPGVSPWLGLGAFLKDLPRSIGIMGFNILYAWRALVACQEAGLAVRREVGIIAGGEDAALFESLSPTLTGIDRNEAALGEEAARVLHRILRGEPVPHETLIPPGGVVMRESTRLPQTDDPALDAALRFIWDHVQERVTVEDVLEQVPMSHRTLLRRFHARFGRTPQDEIRRSRVETAKRLLMATDLPLIEVSVRSGFTEPPQLSRAIRTDTGLTPTLYRRKHLVRG